jgi:GTP-binding protein Era
MSELEFRSGAVALVGRPNVGKSTLLNALLGQKLSIVTPRPQTTRHRVIGLANYPGGQIAFVDTPGLHLGQKRALNRAMNRTAASALADADLVAMVIEGTRWTDEDQMVLDRLRSSARPGIAVINKVDNVYPRDRLLPFIANLSGLHPFLDIVPVSAQKNDNLPALIKSLLKHLPPGEAMYPPEMVTDKSERFRISEIIREKLTLELVEELPYGIAVEVERMEPTEDGRVEVSAVIFVDREGQKPIVIGAGGERLKRIGRSARTELNQLLSKRFHLILWVKVRENWADDARALAQMGLE